MSQEAGHLSYSCPKNALGERKQPERKKRKTKQQQDQKAAEYVTHCCLRCAIITCMILVRMLLLACFRQEDLEEYEDDSDEGFSLSDAIRLSHEAREKEVLSGSWVPPRTSWFRDSEYDKR